ncbi:MAG: TRAP transporter large permease subunit [Boseongicola sp.]|nr:MAG: TRAP transporter large permease subunit [Boseongicola sp.]
MPWRKIAGLSLPFIGSLLTLLVILFRMDYAPEFAAAMGVVVAFIFAVLRSPKEALDVRVISSTIVSAGLAASGLVVMAASVGIIVGVVNATALGVTFTIMISSLAGASLLLALVVAAVASYFLGIGLATTAVYVVCGTLIAPSLVELGLTPIAAHLFVFYTAMLSMITPPVAIGCLAASSLAGANFIRTSMFAVRFGWLKFVLPFIFVYSPELLMIGSPINIVAVIISVAIGIVLFTNALSGYGPRRLTTTARITHLVWAIAVALPFLSIWARFGLAMLALPVLMGAMPYGATWIKKAKSAKQT